MGIVHEVMSLADVLVGLAVVGVTWLLALWVGR
jgi:hypothetical protein